MTDQSDWKALYESCLEDAAHYCRERDALREDVGALTNAMRQANGLISPRDHVGPEAVGAAYNTLREALIDNAAANADRVWERVK